MKQHNLSVCAEVRDCNFSLSLGSGSPPIPSHFNLDKEHVSHKKSNGQKITTSNIISLNQTKLKQPSPLKKKPHRPMPMWSPSRSSLCLINLSRSRLFTHNGLSNLVANCTKLVEIDLSNWTELTNTATMAIAKAKNLEMRWVFLREIVFQVWLSRCGGFFYGRLLFQVCPVY